MTSTKNPHLKENMSGLNAHDSFFYLYLVLITQVQARRRNVSIFRVTLRIVDYMLLLNMSFHHKIDMVNQSPRSLSNGHQLFLWFISCYCLLHIWTSKQKEENCISHHWNIKGLRRERIKGIQQKIKYTANGTCSHPQTGPFH